MLLFKKLIDPYPREPAEANNPSPRTLVNHRDCNNDRSMVAHRVYAARQLATWPNGTTSIPPAVASYNTSVGEALQKFFSKPKLDVSLEEVVTSERHQGVIKKYLVPRTEYDLRDKYPYRIQGFHVKARRSRIRACKAKLKVNGEEAGYLIWETVEPGRDKASTTRELLPEEDEILVIWRASQMAGEETFLFNTADAIHFDLKKFNSPIKFEVTFLSESGPLHKRPYRFKMTLTPWEQIKADEIKD